MWIYEASEDHWQVKKWDETNRRAIVVKEFATHSKAMAFCLMFELTGKGTL